MRRPAPRTPLGPWKRLAAGGLALAVGGLAGVVAGGTGVGAQDRSPEVVVQAPWGTGEGALGRRGGDESAPEGPMSFTVTPAGDVVVLDQANERVVRFRGGKPVESWATGADTFQDVALLRDGRVALLDRLSLRVLRVLSPAGKALWEVGVEGPGIPEGGGVTAMVVADDGVWLEWDHAHSVRVLDAQGAPDPGRPVVRGRPLASGRLRASAWRLPPSGVEVVTVDRDTDVISAHAVMAFDDQVFRVVDLDSDGDGNVVVAVHLAAHDELGTQVVREHVVMVVLDAALREVERIRTVPSVGAWEQFKEVAVGPDGAVYQVVFLDGGVEVRRWAR